MIAPSLPLSRRTSLASRARSWLAEAALEDQAPPERGDYQAHGRLRDVARATEAEVLVEGPAGTGKSRAILQKIDDLALHTGGARILMIRKTGTALAGSGIVTYERDVLGGLANAPDITYLGATPRRPPAYHYRNGSLLVVGGFDRADKVLSTDYDLIFAQEATELTLTDWQTLTTRLRTGILPYQQLIGDCNPQAPSHWLRSRASLRTIQSRHQDNPRYWDEARGDWTPEGDRYVNGILGNLTGVMRERLFLGRWAAAEGAIYDAWDAAVHVLDEPDLVALGIITGARTPAGHWVLGPAVRATYMSQDWGYTHPGCLQVWAEDGDGRAFRLAEVLQTQQIVDPWWVETALGLARHYRPRRCYCDPSEPGYIETYRRKGIPAQAADNKVAEGIQDVKRALAIAPDGRPRLAVLRADPAHADPALLEARKPWCLEQEVEGYVWDTRGSARRGELPIDENDHCCDSARYFFRSRPQADRGRPKLPQAPTRQFAGAARRQFGV